MNILKLKIQKNALRLKRGQIVSPLHYEDGTEQLVDQDGKVVPTAALYVVQAVSLKEGRHSATLRPISYDLAEDRWTTGQPDYQVELDDIGLEKHLGVCRTARKGGIFTEYLRDLFRRYGKGKPFDDTVDYDGVLRGTVNSIFEKSPFHIDPDDRDAIMIDALMQSATKETVQRFDPNDPHPFLMLVLSMFKKKVLTGVNKYNKIHMREVPNKNEEMTDDEFYDTMEERGRGDVTPHSKGPHRELVEKELVKGIRDYLSKTPEHNIMVTMFDMFQAGYQNKEVMEELRKEYGIDLKPVNFSKTYMPKFKDYIWEYAFKTKNKLLMDLMNIQMDKPRLSAEGGFTSGAKNFLQDVLLQYKKVTGGEEEPDSGEARTPVGEVTRVKRTSVPNIMEEDYVAGMVLSDKISSDQFQAEIEDFMSFLGLQDEVLEEGDRITGLKVLDAPRNALELKRDEVQAATTLPDFFKYKVTPGGGQKHPTWGEIYYILTSPKGIRFGLVRPHQDPKEYFQILDLRNGNFTRINGRAYVKESNGKLVQAFITAAHSIEEKEVRKTLEKLGYREGADFELEAELSKDVLVIRLTGTKDFYSMVHQIEKVLGRTYDVSSAVDKAELYLEPRR